MNTSCLQQRTLAATACLAMTAGLAACGGGDDLSAEAAQRPTVTATSPVSATPAVTGVDIHSRVQATFSKPMQSLSITTTTFTLACPAATVVAASVTYDLATRVATLAPTQALPPATTCVATVSADVQDATGLDMAAPYVWRFTTGFALAPVPPAARADDAPGAH